MKSLFRHRSPRYCRFALGFLLVSAAPACGASNAPSGTPSEAAPTAYTWDQVCTAASDRLQRCPKEDKADGPFVKRCPSADHDRACFNTFDRSTGHFLMECIYNTPCGKGSIFENCAENLFTEASLAPDAQQRQNRCRTHIAECNLNFEERCIAPFLKDPLREQMWDCLEKPCDDIRSCAEGVLEQEGCR